ncbi:DUF4336 domain-containing protein [Aliiroseovarius sp. F47248L]|uniref:DUF4336 domain-containing protein n=1 Tax=Aliiroseovarius sp. F47248L TaxID=2926420 RepID=UPI001FF29A06|nr:DUF4336 domain-containing protein [Aliiroseovarius sp. F47248L]MCK0139419.1 DUF4336 domain-containing protein [Aliiroseovarius sp. F47248L]
MLSQFGPEIWLADGPSIKAAAGFHYPTRMVVIRLHGRDLLVWSPIALTDALCRDIETLGTVRYLIAPNTLHHMNMPDWIDAFPKASPFAAPGLQSKRADIAFAGELTETPEPAWTKDIDHVIMTGNAITTEVVFFHRPSGTLLFTDLLQQLPKGWYSGWRALIARLDLMTEPEPAVPRKFRLAFRDKNALRRSVHKIKSWSPRAVVMAHGTPVTQNVPPFLDRAFAWVPTPK